MSAIPKWEEIEYPEDNGEPLADSTLQFRWIQVLAGNLAALFRDRPDVFVGGDLLWYPIERNNKVCAAPDVFVVFGRPKDDRRTYLQWVEAGTPMTVVIEVLSASNRWPEMIDKLTFYDDHGVEEYILLDQEGHRMEAWRRGREVLRNQRVAAEYTSPRLGVRFDLTGPELRVFYPDGQPFLTFEQVVAGFTEAQQLLATETQGRAEAEHRAAEAEEKRAGAEQRAAEAERQRVEIEQRAAEAERQRVEIEQRAAEAERQWAEAERQRVEAERRAADEARRRAEAEQRAKEGEAREADRRLQVRRLRELAAKVGTGTATADEVAEFQALTLDD